MLVAFSVAPTSSNVDGSVHDAVAAAVQIVRESGLPNRTTSMFTNIVHLGRGALVRPAAI